ncbi:UNVERIFIED_CONTAM: hypothetical protein Sradi_3326000 [Sesamum radiatum]|uniref:Prolyl 4-hydroxylase alpha subunit Fe(2+) 2OG dioxygenase domain-containing protein n=1 Tax=Sesamum radiatum TaxID=300843 RepID=A0AAW2R3F3_SESRA
MLLAPPTTYGTKLRRFPSNGFIILCSGKENWHGIRECSETALLILFSDDWNDDEVEDESEFFDRGGTCADDVWVHEIPPHEEDSNSYESWISHGDSEGESSWLAFVHEYYTSDGNPSSVNMSNSHTSRPPPEFFHSPPG